MALAVQALGGIATVDMSEPDPPTLSSGSPQTAAPRRRSVLDDVAALTGASFLVYVLRFVVALVTRRLLGPELTGLWNLVLIVRDQLDSFTLGVHYTAERDMPVHRARGEFQLEANLRAIMLTYLIIEALLISTVYLLYAYFRGLFHQSDLGLGLLILPLLLVLGRVNMGLALPIKNLKAFRTFAVIEVAAAVVDSLMVVYILLGGIVGVFVGLVLSGVLQVMVFWYAIRRTHLYPIRWRFRLDEVRAALPYGVPMGIWATVYTLLLRLDSLFVGLVMGPTSLGYYYLGPQIAQMLAKVPSAIAVVSYPNMMEKFGRGGLSALRPHMHGYVRSLQFLVLPLTTSTAYFGLEAIVRLFLPSFEPGLIAMQTVLFMAFFWLTSRIYLQVLLAGKRMFWVVGITCFSLAVLAAGLWGQQWFGSPTLIGVAWSVVLSQFVYFLLMLLAAYTLVCDHVWREFTEWGPIALVGVAYIVLLRQLDAIAPLAPSASLVAVAATAAAREGIFLLLLGAFLLLTQRSLLQQAWGDLAVYWRRAMSKVNGER